MTQRWYVVQTKPREEGRATYELERQGFLAFCPRLRRRHLGVVSLGPLFPGYIFCSLDIGLDRWRSVNGTRGVLRLLSLDPESPSPVPVGVVEKLAATNDGIIDAVEDVIAFLPGQLLKFTGGPMAGRSGRVQRTSNGRVALLLSLLGRESVVYSRPELLVPA